ncbi:MAG TPA: glycosyltransferase [Chloroflexia bacterium]|nr:glycosyltransferase [Chloroflexia bacterium]
MAKIVLTTFGSTGDLNPFLALGLGLKARGHEVFFAVENDFQATVQKAGFDQVYQLTGDVSVINAYSKELYSSSNPLASLKIILNRYVLPSLPAKIEELKKLCVGVDLIVATSQQFAAMAASELTDVPCATVVLTPASLPSARVSPQPLPVKLPASLQRAVNRLQWSIGLRALASVTDKPVNAIRAGYGLPPRRFLINTGNLSEKFTALAVSPAFLQPQPDWPSQVRMTGFCFWDTPSDWTISPDLAAFLDGTKPVVAVSSGSISLQVKEAFDRFFEVSLLAIRRAGARALVIGANPENLPQPLPDDVMALPFAPFSLVYPRCAVVIHHGGIGTVAQALRAGVPSLVVPWGADQFFNAAQIERIGAGRWIKRKSFSSDKPASVLKEMLASNSSYKMAAQDIAVKINTEDGVGTLCAALEKLLLTGTIDYADNGTEQSLL